MKPSPLKGVHYKRWHTREVYRFQNVICYDATKGKPEGDLAPVEEEIFQKTDTPLRLLFRVFLMTLLLSHISFDNCKDMWAVCEDKFGASDAGNEL